MVLWTSWAVCEIRLPRLPLCPGTTLQNPRTETQMAQSRRPEAVLVPLRWECRSSHAVCCTALPPCRKTGTPRTKPQSLNQQPYGKSKTRSQAYSWVDFPSNKPAFRGEVTKRETLHPEPIPVNPKLYTLKP